jgi:predicted metal-dependent enzyme (double-stranded beta helix superfamily)
VTTIDDMVAACVAAGEDDEPRAAVREVLKGAMADATLARELEKMPVGLTALHSSGSLTVMSVIWPPLIDLFPHNHNMWAIAGIYTGREDNAMFRRNGDTIVAAGGSVLEEGDVQTLGASAIHAVHNPRRAYTGAVHVYGGDFLGAPRSQWDADTLEERPWTLEDAQRAFTDAAERFAAEG